MSETFADLTHHRIEGMLNGRGITIPLISHIDGNLWMGGCPSVLNADELRQFRTIVSLYPWEPYTVPVGTTFLTTAFYDGGEVVDVPLLEAIAAFVRQALQRGPTLVHCQAGLNRSGLVCALALIRDGRAPAAAIAFLRERRDQHVLCNKAFEQWLLEQSAFDDDGVVPTEVV